MPQRLPLVLVSGMYNSDYEVIHAHTHVRILYICYVLKVQHVCRAYNSGHTAAILPTRRSASSTTTPPKRGTTPPMRCFCARSSRHCCPTLRFRELRAFARSSFGRRQSLLWMQIEAIVLLRRRIFWIQRASTSWQSCVTTWYHRNFNMLCCCLGGLCTCTNTDSLPRLGGLCTVADEC